MITLWKLNISLNTNMQLQRSCDAPVVPVRSRRGTRTTFHPSRGHKQKFSKVKCSFFSLHSVPHPTSTISESQIEIYQRISKCHNTNRESLKGRVVKSRRTEESSSASPANYQADNVRNVHSKLKTRYEFIGIKEQWRKSAASCPFLNRPS